MIIPRLRQARYDGGVSHFVLLVLVALAGCSRNSPSGGAAPPAATAKSLASATASAAPTPPAPPANPECQRFVQALKAELAKLPSSCAADKDCTCYPGGVGGARWDVAHPRSSPHTHARNRRGR